MVNHIAGNFPGRKLSRISWICVVPRKFSPRIFWRVARMRMHTLCQWPHPCRLVRLFHESFIREIFIFANSLKFSPSKVSRYTVCLFFAHVHRYCMLRHTGQCPISVGPLLEAFPCAPPSSNDLHYEYPYRSCLEMGLYTCSFGLCNPHRMKYCQTETLAQIHVLTYCMM